MNQCFHLTSVTSTTKTHVKKPAGITKMNYNTLNGFSMLNIVDFQQMAQLTADNETVPLKHVFPFTNALFGRQ